MGSVLFITTGKKINKIWKKELVSLTASCVTPGIAPSLEKHIKHISGIWSVSFMPPEMSWWTVSSKVLMFQCFFHCHHYKICSRNVTGVAKEEQPNETSQRSGSKVYDPTRFEPLPADPQECVKRLEHENSMLREELLHLEEDYRGLQTKRLQDVSITILLLQPALLSRGCYIVWYSYEFLL